AEKIAQITPGNLRSSFFTSSGTEADEAAILIARMATGSYDVVALRHAYSGSAPIQGVGGFITPPKEYFKIVFKIVKKYGGLFISDEVQTGWGRTGKKWFG